MLVLLAIRILAMALSFWGLCGLVGDRLKSDEATTPQVTACLVILVLMASGIVGVLPYAWWALVVGGAAGLIWHGVHARLRVGWCAAALALVAAYACLHFSNAYYTGSDSVSHWGLVAKYLLLTDRFPDASTDLVYFSSYPLGSATFIYYFCRGVQASEGYCLAAQFMLCVICLLPAYGLVSGNRLLGAGLTGTMVLVILAVLGKNTSLQVDVLLACVTLGAVATVARYRAQPRKAMMLALPSALALVLIKSSGMFFALLVILAAGCAARDGGLAPRGRGGLARLLLMMGLAVVVTFAVWQGHVRLAYGAANGGKHALSIRNYLQILAGKSGALIGTIAVKMAKWLVWPGARQRAVRGACLAVYTACGLALRSNLQNRDAWISRLKRLFLASAAVYLVWYGLIFLMYVFSMPVEEARRIASIERYEGTMLALDAGLVALYLIAWLCGGDVHFGRGAYRAALAVLAVLVCVPVLVTAPGRKLARRILRPAPPAREPFSELLALKADGAIEPGKSYLIFTRHSERSMTLMFYFTKYEMFSNDITILGTGIDEPGLGRDYQEDAYYTFDDIRIQTAKIERRDDLSAFVEAYAGRYDYVVLFCEDAAVEAALNAYLDGHGAGPRVVCSY